MTNFEHMKERVLDTVAALDQEELWQLTVDACMDGGQCGRDLYLRALRGGLW